MLGLGQLFATEVMKCLLHRVERVLRTGENAELDQIMEVLRHFCTGHLARSEYFVGLEPQLGNRHAVLSQRAGLVSTQHCRGAERFDGCGAPRQHTRARDTPVSYCHEPVSYTHLTLPTIYSV